MRLWPWATAIRRPKHLASFAFNVELNIKTGHFDRSWRLDFLLVYVSSCQRGCVRVRVSGCVFACMSLCVLSLDMQLASIFARR